MARRGAPNEDLSNIEFETSEDVEVVPTFNSMVSVNRSIILHRCQFYIHKIFTKILFNGQLQGLREELLRAIYAYGEYI